MSLSVYDDVLLKIDPVVKEDFLVQCVQESCHSDKREMSSHSRLTRTNSTVPGTQMKIIVLQCLLRRGLL